MNTYIYKYIFNTTHGEMCYHILTRLLTCFYSFTQAARSVFIFLNLFGNVFETVEIKIALQFSATSRGGAKSPETVWNFEKRLENFLAVVEGQGARVGEVAVVCSPQSVLFPGRDLSLQEFLFSSVRI